MDEKELEAAIEGILFASGEPIHIERICFALSIERGEAERVLRRLQDYYAFERRGMRLLRMDDRWQLCSSPDHADAIRKAFEIRKPAKLSQPALEALTIIAYYQPTTRAYVDKLRGVDSAYTVGLLLERGLIETCGNLQAPGRPLLYRTTEKFLRSFHISSLDELPPLDENDIPPQQLKIEDMAQAVTTPEGVRASPPDGDKDSVETVETPEAENVDMPETVPDADAAQTPETVPDAETVQTSEAVPDADAVQTPETVPDAETVQTSEAVPDADAAQTPEAVPDVDAVQTPEAVPDADAVQTSEAVPDAETMETPETVPDADAVQTLEALPDAPQEVLEPETVDDLETVPEPDTVFPPRELMAVSYPRLLSARPESVTRTRPRRPCRMAETFRTRRKRPGPKRRKLRRIARPLRGTKPPDITRDTGPSDTTSKAVPESSPRRKLSGKTVRRCFRCLLYGCWLSWPFWSV